MEGTTCMKIKISVVVCMACVLFFSGCQSDSLQYVDADIEEPESSAIVHSVAEEVICVHISGEVYFPGVYQVYGGSRVYEVIAQAGGFTGLADEDAVNQAKEVFDGEKITIPSILSKDSESEDRLVNINSADIELLCTIPGIGETRAKQIIEYREKNGEFQRTEDLMKVTGIKEGIFKKIAPYITVS